MVDYLFYSAILQNDLALAFRIYSFINEKTPHATIDQVIEKLLADLKTDKNTFFNTTTYTPLT
jgi:hypothetical protein